jgi:hypothetical protein
MGKKKLIEGVFVESVKVDGRIASSDDKNVYGIVSEDKIEIEISIGIKNKQKLEIVLVQDDSKNILDEKENSSGN